MLPFIVLVIAFLIFRSAGWLGVPLFNSWVFALRPALAIMFLLTASAHWGRRRQDLIRMVPPAFPNPVLLVTITGVLELLGAVGLIIPITARTAATCLALLLIAMFPANVHAARHRVTISDTPATNLKLRSALQFVFVAALIAAGWGHP